MSIEKNVKVIAFVGLAGAGKSVAVDYITEKGYPKVYFGGIIYAAMNEAGIEITPDSQQKFREEIREAEGKDFVVKRVIKQTNDLINAGQHRVVLDGLYSWTEYKILKHEYPGELSVVAVVAPKKLRHHRLANRPERPFTQEEADKRDWTEIEGLEKGGPIAIADHYIINNSHLDNMYRQLDEILEEEKFLN
ncbi:dephospho-CoA kinase [Candidatus Saccharibacteria bacterium HGW-Saccharibacteria-1]|jgi:dephospho-CoA kinase|nr:MAG: dephospho-CoA kinase [Candidatus Saccharibacteria bacterium HGW-Saccharibacteria-1]